MTGEQWPPVRATFDTLEGRIQRGRGAGFLEAIGAPREHVERIVLECLRDDPRWDRQVESRGEYFAELVLARGMRVAPIVELLLARDGAPGAEVEGRAIDLLVDTLCELTGRGDRVALDGVREHLRRGSRWSDTYWTIVSNGCAAHIPELDALLCARCADEAVLADHLVGPDRDEEPWRTWIARSPRIASAFEQLPRTRDPLRRDEFQGKSLAELFEHPERSVRARPSTFAVARPEGTDFLLAQLDPAQRDRTAIAITALGFAATPRAFEAVIDVAERWVDPPHSRRIHEALRRMPAEGARALALRWLATGDDWLGFHARQILTEHARAEDTDVLLATLRADLSDYDEQRTAGLALKALARLAPSEAWNDVEAAFERTLYGYTRRDAADALLAIDRTRFITTRARELLWDAHHGCRELGIEHVDRVQPGVDLRLRELATRPGADEDERTAARARLA